MPSSTDTTIHSEHSGEHGKALAVAPSEPDEGRAKPSWALVGIFLLLALAASYVAQDVLVPIVLAFLFALILSPVVRFGSRRRVPAGVTAAMLVLLATGAVVGAGYLVSTPLAELVRSAPDIVRDVEERVAEIRAPVDEAMEASTEVAEPEAVDPEAPQEVVIKEPGLLTNAAYGAPEVAAKIVLSLVLLFFLLASGDLFYEKLVRVIPRFQDKKRAIKIAYTVERTLSRYLFTITLINAGLGVAVGVVMWLLGMENPLVWGTLAFALNFVPYVGALAGVAFSGLVALVAFDDPSRAVLVPLAYFACTTFEGQFVTPAIVGSRLRMNAVAVFVGVAFWGWMFGIVGMLVAVPVTVAIKIIADNTPGLGGLAEFLAARVEPDEEPAS